MDRLRRGSRILCQKRRVRRCCSILLHTRKGSGTIRRYLRGWVANIDGNGVHCNVSQQLPSIRKALLRRASRPSYPLRCWTHGRLSQETARRRNRYLIHIFVTLWRCRGRPLNFCECLPITTSEAGRRRANPSPLRRRMDLAGVVDQRTPGETALVARSPSARRGQRNADQRTA